VRTPKGSLVTVRAETATELEQHVANGLAALASSVQELEASLDAAPSSMKTAQAAITSAFPNAQVVAEFATPAPAVAGIGGGRTCPHGKMTGLQGPSKTGGVYKGYFCPSAQGDPSKCKTIYINKTDPEWNTFVPDRIK
jgi:hypothetical protein